MSFIALDRGKLVFFSSVVNFTTEVSPRYQSVTQTYFNLTEPTGDSTVCYITLPTDLLRMTGQIINIVGNNFPVSPNF